MADLPVESITEYACEDADITFQLRQVFGPRLTEVAADELFQTVEMPLVKILADMELEGVRIDSDELNRYSQELGKQIDGLTAEIHGHAGQEFNIDSPKQVGPILFETLEIKARVKKTKTGQYPTGEEVLEKIKGNTPLCRPSCATANSKNSSPPMSTAAQAGQRTSGRVHTTYQQTVAATGRLSSKDPNLQNIPIRTEEGRAIRKAFIPRRQPRAPRCGLQPS